jgi:protein SCO1/2
MKQPHFKFALLITVLAMLMGAWLAHLISNARHAPPSLKNGTILTPARTLPEFNLQDTQGHAVSRASLANHWSVLFFGYTSCPDVCPTTLAMLKQTYASLADIPASSQPQFIFVSVDSKRDTAEKLQNYLQYFNPAFVGWTGTQEQLDVLTKSIGVPVIIQSLPDGGYTVDHSASLFVISPQQQLYAVISPPYQPAMLASDLRLLVTQ